MAFNTALTNIFPGYALLAATDPAPSQGIFIPLTDLASITAAEANATTGDSREVLRAILLRAADRIAALPQADRPVKMSIVPPRNTVQGDNVLRQTFTATFDTTYMNTSLAMAPEV